MTEVDKSREQFEKWVKEETGFDLWRTEYPMTEWDGQQYKCHQTNLAWMAWQASRATIEVELPDSTEFDGPDMSGAQQAISQIRETLTETGIKVKS